MIDSFLKRRFDKVGPDYPRKAAFRILLIGQLLVLAAVLLLHLQFSFSHRQLLMTIAIAEVMMFIPPPLPRAGAVLPPRDQDPVRQAA